MKHDARQSLNFYLQSAESHPEASHKVLQIFKSPLQKILWEWMRGNGSISTYSIL